MGEDRLKDRQTVIHGDSFMIYKIMGATRPWLSNCEDQASATSCLTGHALGLT